MSAKTPKEAASLQNTRQMLDELDALMERMLALPVNDLDDASPSPQDIVRMPTVSATLTVLESPVDDAPGEGPIVTQETRLYQIPAVTPEPPSYNYRPEPREEEVHVRDVQILREQAPDPVPEEAIPPSILSIPLPEPSPVVRPLRAPRRSLGSLCVLPLVWANAGFDHLTTFLGWPGRLLRTAAGKQVLGLLGLAFLALAGIWVLKDWLGWSW